jgi:4'-phosphopantetheinyl transferase
VDVWSIALDEPRPRLLTPDEQARADRFRFERDRIHWANAHSALRAILSRYLKADPLDLRFEIGPHGKPSLAGLEFNLSHSGGWAMIAVSQSAPVGIDIEAIRPHVEIAKLLERIGETELEGSQAELFQRWARREAKTKALGAPLMEIPTADLRVVDLEAPEGFAAALAMLNGDPVVRYR